MHVELMLAGYTDVCRSEFALKFTKKLMFADYIENLFLTQKKFHTHVTAPWKIAI